MPVTTEMIKELRALTNAGVLDCKKALEATGGDTAKAAEYLREKGLVAAAKKTSREANDGLVVAKVSTDGQLGALLEFNCETDFVARTEGFRKLVDSLIDQVYEDASIQTVEQLLAAPYAGDKSKTVQQVITETIARLGENMLVRRLVRYEAGKDSLIEGYIHLGNRVGVLVEAECANAPHDEFKAIIHDLALQIAAIAPSFIDRESIPAAQFEEQKNAFLALIADEKKPAAIKERIIEGKLSKWFEEVCLLSQPFIKDNEMTIGAYLEKSQKALPSPIKVKRFNRFERGVSQ